MKLTPTAHALIEEAIKKAVTKYATKDGQQSIVTDIHLQPNPTSGELTIFDDDDRELSSVTIDGWASYNDEENFYDNAERVLTSILNKLKSQGCFDSLSILKPYSFVMIDDEKETVTELLLMDDDTPICAETTSGFLAPLAEGDTLHVEETIYAPEIPAKYINGCNSLKFVSKQTYDAEKDAIDEQEKQWEQELKDMVGK